MSDDFDIRGIFLEELDDLLGEWERACLDLERHVAKETIDSLFRVAHSIKGSSRTAGFLELGDYIHKIEDLLVRLQGGTIEVSAGVVEILLAANTVLTDWAAAFKSGADFAPDPALLTRVLALTSATKSPDKGAIATAAPPVDNPGFVFFDDPPESGPALGGVLEKPDQALPVAFAEPKAATSAPIRQAENVRVSIAKIDRILRSFGELTISAEILSRCKSDGQLDSDLSQQVVDDIARMVRSLHDETLSLNMNPLDALMQNLERTARDVARSQGKSLNVRVVGQSTEVDRTIAERLKDPLVHIVRNAVDHGVEDEAGRKLAKKAPIADLLISAEQISGDVVIKIVDDGKGLNLVRIREKAIEKGMVGVNDKLTDQQLTDLILLPGFSTAEKITGVSGRGVGMDVVSSSVKSIGGALKIKSELGKGSTFTIEIPAKVAMLEAFVIESSPNVYAVPVSDVARIVNIDEYRMNGANTKAGPPALDIDGEIVPLVSLRQALRTQSPVEHGLGKETLALIVSRDHGFQALSFDVVHHTQNVFIRRLAGPLGNVPTLAGSTILNDGQPALVLNLPAVIGRNEEVE